MCTQGACRGVVVQPGMEDPTCLWEETCEIMGCVGGAEGCVELREEFYYSTQAMPGQAESNVTVGNREASSLCNIPVVS